MLGCSFLWMLARLVAETLVFKAAELGCVGLWRRFLRPAELLPDEQLHPQPAEMADVAVNPTIFTILSLLNGPALLHRDSWTSATYVPHHIYSSSLHWRQESISGDPHGRPFVPLQPPHLTDIVYYAGERRLCVQGHRNSLIIYCSCSPGQRLTRPDRKHRWARSKSS